MLLAIFALGVARAACPEPVTSAELQGVLRSEEAAYAARDVGGFTTLVTRAHAMLPCLDEPVTPTLAAARSLVRAGADIIALDATHRPRQGSLTPEALIQAVQAELGCPVMADIDSLEEGIWAAEAGADLVATTMAGYTPARPMTEGPDLDLLRALAARVPTPVVCEGRIASPANLAAAFDAGAFAVVVGTAITNPLALTQSFAGMTRRRTEDGRRRTEA